MSQAEQSQTDCDSFAKHEPMGLRLVVLVGGLIENSFATLVYSGLRKRLFGGVPKQNRIFSVCAQILFDAQQLIVFCNAVAASRCSGFYLPTICRNSQISDGRVFCFATAMTHHTRVIVVICESDCVKGLRQSANLIYFYQNTVGGFSINALL